LSRPGRARDPRAELVEHLKFLREMGVREIRTSARPAERASAPAPPSAARAAPASTARPSATPSATPAATQAGAARALAHLREKEIGDCRRCRLCEKRTQIVFGVGDPGARLLFVGEGPGRDEDAQGIPFVGRAGQLLTDIIRAMGLTREQVYIANVVKCRPPENRTPEPDEIESCLGFLESQIEIISPSVIVCLGAVAAQALVDATGGITKMRGNLREYRGIPVMPTFHPAYLLRNPAAKKDVWADMKKVMALLAGGTGSS
jgi:uracil-DNA glycosylase